MTTTAPAPARLRPDRSPPAGRSPSPSAGAAAAGATQPLRLMLDYFPNADHAGIYAADAGGAYEKAGLDVDITPPPDPSAPLKLLLAGRTDLAISYEPELLLARDKGAELVAVGALVQKPLTSLMAVGKAGVRTPQDLRGKRVGTSGIPYQSAYLKTILETAGVDPGSVRETNVGFNLVPAMLSGKVDATLGAFWNYEGTDLAAPRPRPGDPADGEARRADLQRAGLRRAAARSRRGVRREGAALHAGDRARARGAEGRPVRGAARAARGRRGTRPRAAGGGRRRRRCRSSSPRTPSGRSATRTRPSGSATPTGCSKRA